MKDRVVSWFLKNVIMQDKGKIDTPGYITMNSSRGKMFRRQVLIPESVLVNIEEEAARMDQQEDIYGVGKEFGWRFASTYNPPKFAEAGSKSFKREVYFLVKFVGSTFASKASHKMDPENEIFEFEAENYVICRHSGEGQLMFEGGIPGVWGYLMDDFGIEGVKTSCQGRGDPKCEIVCGKPEELRSRDLEPYISEKTDHVEMSSDYSQYNSVKPTDYCENSLKDYIDTGFFDYSKGVIKHGNERMFLAEIGLPQLLGAKMSEELNEVIFKQAFETSREIAASEGNSSRDKFITEYMGACGWGDIRIKEQGGEFEIICLKFPWTRFSDRTEFPLFCGIISGLLSGFQDEEINLSVEEKDVKGVAYSIILTS